MFYKYKYLINWDYEPIHKGDLVKWFLEPNKELTIDTIYTYNGNPGCYHDRIKLKDAETGETIETSMIMFSSCELYRNEKWNEAIIVER